VLLRVTHKTACIVKYPRVLRVILQYMQENEKKAQGATFADIGVPSRALQVLNKRKITEPTPIQHQAIPAIMSGNDCIGIAQTGTGKTLAFALPMVEDLAEGGTAIVLAPTRELAQQIQETFLWFDKSHKVTSTVVVGGASMHRQIQELRKKPKVVVATPGRMIDLLNQGVVRFSKLKYLVLDEADRMFDMGFAPQLRKIFSFIPGPDERQTLLFSATMPDQIVQLVREHMRTPVRIEVAPQGTAAENVEQEIIILDRAHRKTALIELIKQTKGTVIVFTRTKYQAKEVTKFLNTSKFRSEELHGNRTQGQRKRAMDMVQSGKSRILVATDIAARGIDISAVELVINFELPDQAEDYVHRIGRTGRAQLSGRAVSLVLSDQGNELRDIQKLVNMQIPVASLPGVPAAQLSGGSSRSSNKFGGRRGGGGGRRSGGGSSRGRSGGGRSSSGGSRGPRRRS